MFGNVDLSAAINRLVVAFIPLALGIIVHEVAHGWVAGRKGDPTATREGRITLNPLAHVDPTGLLAFVLTSLTGPFVFGWAKPVPVDYRYLRNPLKDMVVIAAAGPVSNFCMAILFALAFKGFLWALPPTEWSGNVVWDFMLRMLPMGIGINCSLAWLNLMPIPPLDGSKIVAGFLPYRLLVPYMNISRYGFVILIVLLATGLLGEVLYPLINVTLKGILLLTGLR